MTDFQQRLELELRRAIDAHEAHERARRRTISLPLPRIGALVSVGAVAIALVIGIAIGRNSAEDERAAEPVKATLPAGTYRIDARRIDGVYGTNRFELWIREGSVRLIGTGGEGTLSQLLGLTTVSGNRVQLLIDPARSRTSDFDDPRCRSVGTYDFAVSPQGIRFTLVSDSCPVRRAALDGRTWRR